MPRQHPPRSALWRIQCTPRVLIPRSCTHKGSNAKLRGRWLDLHRLAGSALAASNALVERRGRWPERLRVNQSALLPKRWTRAGPHVALAGCSDGGVAARPSDAGLVAPRWHAPMGACSSAEEHAAGLCLVLDEAHAAGFDVAGASATTGHRFRSSST